MSWKIYLKKGFSKKEKYLFFDIIKNFDFSGDIIFKERNTLRKIKSDELDMMLAVKSFKIPHLFNQYIYSYFRKSKAARSFQNAKILLSKGINTPMPLAYFEESNTGRLKRSFFLSEYYSYDFTFRELIEKKDNFNDWKKILDSFTQFIFHVHENNILFKDLSPGNVLMKRFEDFISFSLIDLNRMSFKRLSIDERLQNFIRLSLTEEMIPIIGKKYAELSSQDSKEIITILTTKNKAYIKKKERKKRLKQLIGKSYF